MSTTVTARDTAARHEFKLEGGLSTPLAAGLTLALVAEGVVLHLWISARSEMWAWGLTVLNVATLIWLWREVQASSRSTISVSATEIVVNAGSRLRCRIPWGAVERVEEVTWRAVPQPRGDYVDTAKPLEPNVVIALSAPASATLPFGLNRSVSRLGIRVANPTSLVAALGLAGRRPD
jgi:hypothetical protein